jgi:small subunit ribosomal protein S17
MSEEKVQRHRKEFVGTVISDKMQKTIVVQVARLVKHPRYPKIIRSKARFKAHDEKNAAHIGDRVRIMETRPLSRDKRWRLVEIIARAKTVETGHDL